MKKWNAYGIEICGDYIIMIIKKIYLYYLQKKDFVFDYVIEIVRLFIFKLKLHKSISLCKNKIYFTKQSIES
jgi:hypothetical protein